MGNRKNVYALPLKYPMDTRQAYELMLDIEVGRLYIIPDVKCEVYKFQFVNDRILIDTTVANIEVVCTSTEIVFKSKLKRWMTIASTFLYILCILLIPMTFTLLATIADGVNIMFVLGVFMLLFGLWMFSRASHIDKDNQAVAKRLVELIYDNI